MKMAERDLPLWLGGAAISAIALGQMAVVLDALAVAHPSWPFWVLLVVAAGFELAVLSTGLAVMLTGDRWLAVGEVALLAVSVACGWWTIMYRGLEPPRIVVAATLAWLPLQYLIATAALHKLYYRGQQRPSRPRPTTQAAAIASVVVQQAATSATANGQLAAVRPATLQRARELAAIRDGLSAANGGKEPTAAQVAEAAGVPERTARRLLEVAQRTG